MYCSVCRSISLSLYHPYNLTVADLCLFLILHPPPCFTADDMQIAGGQPEHISKIAKLLENETSSDFVDLNCGCPLDTICNRSVNIMFLYILR